jgi:ferric-chelate reductase
VPQSVTNAGCISWFSRQYRSIAAAAALDSSIKLEFKFFITCTCDCIPALEVPNSEVIMERPIIGTMLKEFLNGSWGEEADDLPGGGVAVGACGPAGMTREIRNAVASLGPNVARRVGGIQVHTESFTL